MTSPSPTTFRPRRVLNLGAGTQSSVLLVMADRGEIEPVEVAIFADTQAEPREVYEHLDWLEKQVKTPVVRVSRGDLHAELNRIPLYVKGENIHGTMLRTCTDKFKIQEIRRYIRQVLLKLESGQRTPEGVSVDQLFGISFDERHRMRISHEKWLNNLYPLVDLKLTRNAVIAKSQAWFPGHEFPRSACTFCPFKSDAEWRRLRDTDPDGWKDAVAVDELMRSGSWSAGKGIRGVPFLHRSMEPLATVDLRTTDQKDGQLTLDGMANECEGMCGV